MAGQVKITIDEAAVVRVVGGAAAEAAARAAQVTMRRAQQNIRALGRVQTGQMVGTMSAWPEGGDGLRPAFRVGSAAEHTAYQEFGTRGSVARPGKFLVFKPKGSSAFVFAKKTRPVRPGRFMQNALEALQVSDYIR